MAIVIDDLQMERYTGDSGIPGGIPGTDHDIPACSRAPLRAGRKSVPRRCNAAPDCAIAPSGRCL